MNTLWLELNSWVNTWWYEVTNLVFIYVKLNKVSYSKKVFIKDVINNNTINTL